MAFHSREQLEGWVDEFRARGWDVWPTLRVVIQDGTEGGDTGLIMLAMENVSTNVYIQTGDDARWLVTFEGRDEPVELDAPRLDLLGTEVTTLSSLVAFLQGRSDACSGSEQVS